MAISIIVPALGESVTEATVSKWLKNLGEPVIQDEPLCELETDKVAIEIYAPKDGILSEVLAAEGSNVEVGGLLGYLTPANKESSVKNKISKGKFHKEVLIEDTSDLINQEKITPQYNKTSELDLSPAVRKLILESGIDTGTLIGSGKNGRITKGDVISAINVQKIKEHQPKSENATSDKHHPTETTFKSKREDRVKMSRLRQRIADRLKTAQNTSAILTTFNEVDMTNVIDCRKKYREIFERKFGVPLGFMSFFVKASVIALKEQPIVNAEVDEDEIIYKNYWDIGVAISTPKGLIVPVLRNADKMDFAEIEMQISNLGDQAREGKLSIESMLGGTFTISNGGIFGSMLSTPILNPPQSAILGMHKIQNRPFVVNSNEIKIRPIMYLALSYDHRIIDGKEAVTFLNSIKDYIESPERMLFGL